MTSIAEPMAPATELPPDLLALAERVVIKNYRAVRRRLDGTTVLMAHQLRTEVDDTGDQIWSLIDGRRSVLSVAELLSERRGFQLQPCLLFTIEVVCIFLERELVELASPESSPAESSRIQIGNSRIES